MLEYGSSAIPPATRETAACARFTGIEVHVPNRLGWPEGSMVLPIPRLASPLPVNGPHGAAVRPQRPQRLRR
jgi:hypothetical protein